MPTILNCVRAHAVQIEEQLVRIQYIARQTLSFFRDAPQSQTKDLVPLVEAALRYQAGLAGREAYSGAKRVAGYPGRLYLSW